MTKTNNSPSQSLKSRVISSGIQLKIISERSNIKYPRLRALINDDAKLLYDEGVLIEHALQQSLSSVQKS